MVEYRDLFYNRGISMKNTDLTKQSWVFVEEYVRSCFQWYDGPSIEDQTFGNQVCNSYLET